MATTKDIKQLYANNTVTATGISNITIVTPAGLKYATDGLRANTTVTATGTDDTKFVTPKSLKDNYFSITGGYIVGTLVGINGNNGEYRIVTTNNVGWRMNTSSTGSTLGNLTLQGTTDNFSSSIISGLTISPSGQVGIGKTPTNKLDVAGSVTINGATRIGSSSNNTDIYNIGDNTQNRVIDLDIAGISSNTGYIRIFRNTNTTGAKGFQIYRGDSTLTVDHSLRPGGTNIVSNINQNGGTLVFGHTAAFSPVGADLQQVGTTSSTSIFSQTRSSADAFGSVLSHAKSRGATIGTHSVVLSGDNLGRYFAYGSDGTNFIKAASVEVEVDGTPGTNNMPGRILFKTTLAGASDVTERMRITNDGRVGIGVTPTNLLHVAKATGDSIFTLGTGRPLSIYTNPTNEPSFNGMAGYSIRFAHTTNGVDVTGYSEKMRISPSGALGIGTTGPEQIVDARGWIQSKATANTWAGFIASSPAGYGAVSYYKTAGVHRWEVGKGITAESGSNAGSNFVINRYDDSGTYIDTALGISRSSGVATFSTRPTFGVATPWDSANFDPSTKANTSDATDLNTASKIVKRDASGNFAAGTITATLNGSASKLTTSRTIAISGDATGSASFDGSANITIASTLANSGATAGSYGSATSVAAITVDAKGRITAVTSTPIGIATSAVTGLDAALAAKAPISSPAFTGTPVAATAPPGTNTDQIATTAFVTNVASGKADAVHIHPIADVTGLQTALDSKAPIASPTFTGVPSGPTASTATNTTQLATTAFVQSNMALKASLTSAAFTGPVSFSTRPTFGVATPWDSANFDPNTFIPTKTAISAYDILATKSIAAQPLMVMDIVRGDYFVYNVGEWSSISDMALKTGLGSFTRASIATYFGPDGLIKTAAVNEPRLEFDPVSRKPLGLLIEATRTNYNTSSGDQSAGTYSVTRGSKTGGITGAPDGTASFTKVVEDTSTTNSHYIYRNVGQGGDPTVTQCFSAYVKAGERFRGRISFRDFDAGQTRIVGADFNLSTNAISMVTASGGATNGECGIDSIGNGIYRIWVTGILGSGTLSQPWIYLADGTGQTTYTGDGTSGLYTWGWQLEVGARPSSYIPTTTAAVTRSSESFSLIPTSYVPFGNNTSVLLEYRMNETRTGASNASWPVAIGDSGYINFIAMREGASIAGSDLYSQVSGVPTIDTNSFTTAAKTNMRFAWASDTSGSTFAKEGSVITFGATSYPTSMDRVSFGRNGFMGHIRRFVLFQSKLTNVQLQDITSLDWPDIPNDYVSQSGGYFTGIFGARRDNAALHLITAQNRGWRLNSSSNGSNQSTLAIQGTTDGFVSNITNAATFNADGSTTFGAGGTFSGLIRSSVSDGNSGLLINGASKGIRIVPSSTGTAVEGVDNTGVGSYQPLTIKGSTVSVSGPTSFTDRPTFNTQIPFDTGNVGWVTPEMYGAVGDGTTDDTTAIQNAVNTGKSVFFNNKDYKITTTITVSSKTNQRLVGGNIVPYGNISGITVSGSKSCIFDLSMKCANQGTAYYAMFFNSNSERCTVRKLHILDNGANGIYIEQCNCITVDWFYGINLRGTRGIYWYGSSSLRSDILNINFAAIAALSGNQALIGIHWNGNCNSLQARNVHTVNCIHGLLIDNSSGGPIPQIGRFDTFCTDFSYSHGINIVYADDIDFIQPYINGAGFTYSPGQNYHGILVNNTVGTRYGQVRVMGGKSIGNSGYGICSGISGVIYANGTSTYSNGIANTYQLHPSSVTF